MSLEDIKSMKTKIPAADNAILFLWTTIAMLKESLKVMDSWGFTYRSHVMWVKEGNIGLGYYVRAQHKYLELFARKKRSGWTAWGNELVEDETECLQLENQL